MGNTVPFRMQLSSIGGTKHMPVPYRWVVEDEQSLPTTVTAEDLNKEALILSLGRAYRVADIVEGAPVWSFDPAGGYRMKVIPSADGIIDISKGQAFKVNTANVSSIALMYPNMTGEMVAASIMVEGNNPLEWPVEIDWVGGSAPELGEVYTLVVLAFYENAIIGQKII